jgi:hypothetical protein
MPSWFAEALACDAKAHKGWEALTPSRQKEIVRYLGRLKSPEAFRFRYPACNMRDTPAGSRAMTER